MLEVLRKICKNYIIGEGGYGIVYKLEILGYLFLVVKKFKICLEFEWSFENELDIFGILKYRNLVKFKGFCFGFNVKFLFYDYLLGGNFD